MIRWIVGSSMKLRLLVVAIAAAMMFLGIRQVRRMPVDVLPEFAPPYVEIQTEALGLSAEEVAQLITIPFEQDLLNGVAWLESIRSKSVPGMSSIMLTFEPGTDLFRARQMVSERVAQAYAMPHVSKPPAMMQPVSSTNRVMMIRLSSKQLSLIQMSMLARWTIGPRLMGVPGVANVATWGQRERQLQVQVDPNRMRAGGVTLEQVLETTGNALWVSSLSFVEASTPGTGGFIDTANQRLGIRHISPIVTAESLAQVPIADQTITDQTNSTRAPLRLSDVANVVEDHQPLIGDAVTDDVPSLLLVVEKFPGSNTLEVTSGLEAALAALQPGLSGVEIDSSVYRPADSIQLALGNLSTTLIISGVLVVLVLLALLSDLRSGLISLVAVVTSLLSAGLVLYLTGATVNAIMLAGFVIAIGVVVDDAIIDVENVVRRLRQNRQETGSKSTASVILEASIEMRSAMAFGMLIIALTVLPIFFINGTSGDFFRPLAVSYGLALLASTLVALTVTPALCVLLLTNAPALRREAPLVRWLRPGFDGVLARSLLRPGVALVAIAGVVVVGLAVLPFFRQSLLPNFKERTLLIHVNAAPGTSQPEMSRIAALINRELRSIPGVREVGASTGRAVRGDQVVGVNSAELWVSFDPTADYDTASAAVREAVHGYPGLHAQVLTYLNERSSPAVETAGDPINVRVFGEESTALRAEAEKVRKAISEVDGVVDSHVTLPVEEPTLEIQPNLATAQRYGIKPGDVRRAAATMLSGINVGNLFEEQKVFDVVVWSTPETRRSLDDIRGMLIDTPSGGHVRLGDVAQVKFVSTPNLIEREAVSRYLDVGASVRGRDVASVRSDVEQRLKQVQFPLEYHAEVRGEFAGQQAAESRRAALAAAAAIGILFLLQAAFRSWRLATGVFVALPAALVGGVLAAFANGAIVSLGAIIGLLTLLAIAVRNGVTLITHYRALEQHEGDAFSSGLVLRGTRERFAPIVTTALTTALAFLPFALRGPIAGLEIVHPMAVVILGGLVVSTAFSLFGVPSLYLLLGAKRESDLELDATGISEREMRDAVSGVQDLELV
jgi:CzcA family heavy metal efflux pump